MAKNSNAEAQGFVIFHDIMEDVDELDNETAGLMLKACFRYSKFSKDVIVNLDDKLARSVWRRLKNQIDYGKARRKATCERNKENSMYAAYKRKAKEQGIAPLSKDEWYDEYGAAVMSDDTERYRLVSRGTHREIEHENDIEIDTEEETEWGGAKSVSPCAFQQGLAFEDMRAEKIRQLEGMK